MRAKVPEIYDYRSAKRALERAPRSGRIGNNTTIFDDGDGGVGIMLHNTVIVTYHSDDAISLNSGGYRTVTTKSRINSLLPPGIEVVQRKGEWSVEFRDGYKQPFRDHMVLAMAPNGRWVVSNHPSAAGRKPRLDEYDSNPPVPREGDKVTGYLLPNRNYRLADFNGKLLPWRYLWTAERYTNEEGDSSQAVVLEYVTPSGAPLRKKKRYAVGYLLVDGGSLFRGEVSLQEDRRHLEEEAKQEAQYWAAQDDMTDPDIEDDEDARCDNCGHGLNQFGECPDCDA